jgi:imidazolonepropionase-like amidohydrolase
MRFQAPPTPASKLIRAGRILDVKSGRYLLDQGILTDGEKIKAIGPWEEIRAHASNDAALIDLSQATLLPGLIDCHAHLLISGDLGRLDPSELLATTLAQMSASSRALLGARNAVQDIALLQHVQFVMKGATLVRNDFAKSQLPPSR